MSLQEIKSRSDKVRGAISSLETRLENTRKEISEISHYLELADKVIGVFHLLLDHEVMEGASIIEKLETEGLQAVFDNLDISAKVETDIQRNKVCVNLLTVQNKNGMIIEGEAEDNFGGSVLTLESVLLRIATIIRRDLRPFILLDEAFADFDADYIENIGKLLRELCSKLHIDILLVTHNQALMDAADHAYRTVPVGDHTEIVKER